MIVYTLAIIMVFISPTLLLKFYNIDGFWNKFWIMLYMIIYGALMVMKSNAGGSK